MNQQIPQPVKDGLGHFRGAHLWYDFCFLFYSNTFANLFSLRTEGMHNVPQSGPLLVVANHQSFLDPVAIGLAVRRQMIYLARKTLFRNRAFTWLIRSLNAVPIDQQGIGKEGIRTVSEQLHMGKAVLVFPEGERTPHGDMLPLKPGVHLLIKRTMATILPVGIAGAYASWPRRRKFPIPAPLFMPAWDGTVAVSVGQPLEARRFAELPREQALQALFDEIQKVQLRAERLRRKWRA
jgi:1-acyl-sn-glycerol-3-phosphate acyltransferase